MKRYTDPILFGFLFLISAAAWAIMAWQHVIPESTGRELADMTVAVAVVISVPALLFVTIMALIRSLFNISPKPFWAAMAGGSALAAGAVSLANLMTSYQDLEIGFSTGIWLLSIAALASLVALILALTGAIPTPEPKPVADEAKSPAKLSKREQRAEAKQQLRDAEMTAKAAREVAPAAADQGPPVLEEETVSVVLDDGVSTDSVLGEIAALEVEGDVEVTADDHV